MPVLSPVVVPRRPIVRLQPIVGAERFDRLLVTANKFRDRLAGRTIWNVSSTAVGGGVAEMLQALVGYVADLDMDIRWMVINGDAPFFTVTKRLHNRLHGVAGDTGTLGGREAIHYEGVLAANVGPLVEWIKPGDLVLLHDPQTAGLVAALVEWGARVVWRCHIGRDDTNEYTEEAWSFLRPYLSMADAFVFSRRSYVPSWMPDSTIWIIPPSIDPFSPKNQFLSPPVTRSILSTIGVLPQPTTTLATPRFTRRDGSPGQVRRRATVVADALPDPAEHLAVQVSRWDRLKDMSGVMRGFAEYTAPAGDGRLVLVGPAVEGVSDDPEGAQVYQECLRQWRELPDALRERVMLVTLPLDDVDENAAMVNALQRHATVIAQKSLVEGFGLTIAEGMWKGRPVVASAVGGIQEQVVPGTGTLLPDPTDLAAFGAALRRFLDKPDLADWMGDAAHDHVREHFVGDLHLLRHEQVLNSFLV